MLLGNPFIQNYHLTAVLSIEEYFMFFVKWFPTYNRNLKGLDVINLPIIHKIKDEK